MNYKDISLKSRDLELVLTGLQQHWLNTYGGRDVSDVYVNDNKMVIILTGNRNDYFREIPTHNELKNNLNNYFSREYIRNNYVIV